MGACWAQMNLPCISYRRRAHEYSLSLCLCCHLLHTMNSAGCLNLILAFFNLCKEKSKIICWKYTYRLRDSFLNENTPASPLFQVHSPEDIQRIVDTVVESTAKIIVVFSSDVDLSPLIGELLRQNVTNRTWIASEAWVTSALINQPGVRALSHHIHSWVTGNLKIKHQCRCL